MIPYSHVPIGQNHRVHDSLLAGVKSLLIVIHYLKRIMGDMSAEFYSTWVDIKTYFKTELLHTENYFG